MHRTMLSSWSCSLCLISFPFPPIFFLSSPFPPPLLFLPFTPHKSKADCTPCLRCSSLPITFFSLDIFLGFYSLLLRSSSKVSKSIYFVTSCQGYFLKGFCEQIYASTKRDESRWHGWAPWRKKDAVAARGSLAGSETSSRSLVRV